MTGIQRQVLNYCKKQHPNLTYREGTWTIVIEYFNDAGYRIEKWINSTGKVTTLVFDPEGKRMVRSLPRKG